VPTVQVFGFVDVNKGVGGEGACSISDVSFETAGINNLVTGHNKPENLNYSESFVIHCAAPPKVTIQI
jgi:hypothetical protein